MRLALFDLDNTLLAGDSDYEWGQFLVDRGVVDRAAYEAQNRAFYDQYKAGTLDIHEYLGFALRPLAGREPEELARWHADFMRTRIVPMVLPAARTLVRRHLDAQLRHHPDRPRIRRPAPDRHRARAAKRPFYGPGRGHPVLPCRQARAAGRVARRPGAKVRRFRGDHLL